jgi:hypothetical protein
MISDTPPSHYECIMNDKEMNERSVYNMIIVPWNVIIVDLFDICRFRPYDLSLKEILRNSYEMRLLLIESYNLTKIDKEFNDTIDHEYINDFLNSTY